ncbi:MAG TPA: HAMP domain-containing sensor histidine kinase [Thermoanaerobaculia bacterium]|nr:HAMP domain-containing sensor histidine kinase [Thermoanaerobaculia bacterium]
MALFGRSRPAPADPASLAKLKARLSETQAHPLLRIPSDDLAGDAREVAEHINRRLDALAASEKEQQQFIADVSHELRTPLTVLRGSLEVALEEERPAEEYRESIGNALLEVRHLTRISQNLLFLTRGESGRVTLSFANLDLGRFAADTVRDLAPAAADRQMHLEAAGPAKPVYVFADAGRLQQVLHNLIENALQYGEPGGRIHVRVASAPGEATLAVSDTGIGIPEDDLPYIFERFFRSKRSRRANPGGSGLGLSIVRWIVEAHKGRITAESTPGKGSTFTVRLPVI